MNAAFFQEQYSILPAGISYDLNEFIMARDSGTINPRGAHNAIENGVRGISVASPVDDCLPFPGRSGGVPTKRASRSRMAAQ